MADLYVRSTDGNDADNGSTWALANAATTGAVADAVAGDRIFYSQAHSENIAANIVATFPGTLAAPNQLICGNDAAEPPTTVATGAQIGTNGNFAISLNGNISAYGLSVFAQTAGATSASAAINLAAGSVVEFQLYDTCAFRLGSLSATPDINVGASGKTVGASVVWRNCTIRMGNAGQTISVFGANFQWIGGSVVSGSSSSTALFLFGGSGRGGNALVESVDFSNFGSTFSFVTATSYAGRLVLRNCKLPSGWTGGLFASAPTQPGMRAEMHNCDSGDTNYRLWVQDYSGSIYSETVIVRSGGASDGTTPFSWRMASDSGASYPLIPLASPELSAWNDTTGSAITATVEVVTDGVTLNDDECWLEVQYLGTSGAPLGAVASDCKADILASAAAQTSSSETWTTTGLSSPVKQKLSVTFTPQERGFFQAVVKLAKASATVYVDPMLTVT